MSLKKYGTDAAAGGAAYGAFLGGGNATARLNDRINAPKYQANRKPNDKKVKAVKQSLGLRSDQKISDYTTKQKNDFFRNYPKDVPGGKVKRVQARVWGANKYGKAGPAAGAVVAGAGAAALLQHHRVKKSFIWDGLTAEVSKSMPDQSAVHVLGGIGKLTKVKTPERKVLDTGLMRAMQGRLTPKQTQPWHQKVNRASH